MKWFAALGTIFLLMIGYVSLPRYLESERDIHAKILVVEGWISDEAIQEALQTIANGPYSTIYTTGGPMPQDFKMLLSGDLDFFLSEPLEREDSITVNAFGSTYKQKNAHFILLVNHAPAGEDTVTTELKPYRFKLADTIKSIKSLVVRFDNDAYENPANDRNLMIRSVLVGKKELPARNDLNMYTTIFGNTPAHTSYARKVEFELKQRLPGMNIIAVPSSEPDNGRTNASAKVLHQYLEQNHQDTSSMEIFSQGIHTRRSWLTYRNIFGKETSLGCVSAYDSDFTKGWWKSWMKNKRVWREITGVIYYQVVLFFKSF